MTQMASNMDPSVMGNMMKSMGGPAAGMDPAQLSEQMKQMGQMSPEQLRAGMTQAQSQMNSQKQYYYNAAMMLKNEGNNHIKSENYTEAVQVYNKALENIKSHSGDDVIQLRLSLLLNLAMCYLKQKDYKKTVEVSEEALSINSKSVKALFRRGLARFESGELATAVADVKMAAKLSPDDKTIAAELARVEADAKNRGMTNKDLEAALKKLEANTSKAVSGGSSSSSSAAVGGLGDPNMAKTMEQFAKNPDMIEKATEAMKHMSPEDIERMMQHAPLPPGVDRETAKSRLEAVSKNPEMLKTAMEAMKAMPEEERKKLMEVAQQGGPGMVGPGGMPDMSQVGKLLENPETMKQMAEMAKAMGGGGEEAEMMQKMADMMASNPEMGKTMSEMMKNIDPEQMQKMMDQGMRRRGQGSSSSSDAGPPDMSDMLNNPEMMKAAEEMMKNMSPEMLTSMAKSSGLDINEDQAKMMTKLMPFIPYAMKAWRCFSWVKKNVFSSRGRVLLAAFILAFAVFQHYYWSRE